MNYSFYFIYFLYSYLNPASFSYLIIVIVNCIHLKRNIKKLKINKDLIVKILLIGLKFSE